MKILKEGDKSSGLCESCESRVPMTYKYKAIALKKSKVKVPHVLVGVCDTCNETIAIPAQSIPRLKDSREKAEKKIELKPQPLKDDIIEGWFRTGHFGHDVSNPFSFPYIKYFTPPSFKKGGGREFVLAILESGGYIVKGIVIIIKYLYEKITCARNNENGK